MVKLRALLSRRYYKSWFLSKRERKYFTSIRTYSMFIGYPRSGHSFLSALLDAHPNIVMGMEVDALNLLEQGYSRDQIYYCLLNNSRIFNQLHKNVWTGYSYAIPNSHQGKFEEILIIGDKKGGRSTIRLEKNPKLIEKLSHTTQIPIKIFHVIRNPYDNISTMILRNIDKGQTLTPEYFKLKIELYFQKVEINNQLKQNYNLDILDIYHEDVISNPEETLKKMLNFLNIEASKDFLKKCVEHTYQKPNLSRHKLEWTKELIYLVEQKLKNYSFLNHYRFEEE